jgi:hypothetical protein
LVCTYISYHPNKKTKIIYDSENPDTGNFRLVEHEPKIPIIASEREPEKGYDIVSLNFPKNITRIGEIIPGIGLVSKIQPLYLINKITIGPNVTFETIRTSDSCKIYDSEIYSTPFDEYFVNRYYKYPSLIFSGELTHFIGSYQEQKKAAGTYVFQGKIVRQYTWIQGQKNTFYEWKGQWTRQRGNIEGLQEEEAPLTPEYVNPFTEPLQGTMKTDALRPEDAARITAMRSQLTSDALYGFESIRVSGHSFNRLFLGEGCFTEQIRYVGDSQPFDALFMLPSEQAVRAFQAVWYGRRTPDFSYNLEAKFIPFKNQPYKLLVITFFEFNGVRLLL